MLTVLLSIRDFTTILLVVVYIPPSSNNSDRNKALSELYHAICEQQTTHPDGFLIVAGDFNHADLKSMLLKTHQHVNFSTRGNNTLDQVYTTHKGGYRGSPLPHIGLSDYTTVMLIPAYRPRVKAIKTVLKQVQMWPDITTYALQDCFDTTGWDMCSHLQPSNQPPGIYKDYISLHHQMH